MKNKKAILLPLILLAFMGMLLRFSFSPATLKHKKSTYPKSEIKEFVILSSPEHRSLEAIIARFARHHLYPVRVQYLETKKLMAELSNPAKFDAIWPASSIWLKAGDEFQKTKYALSVTQTPVVIGLKKILLNKLNLESGPFLAKDFVNLLERKQISLLSTAPGFNNSGTGFYLALNYALTKSNSKLAPLKLSNLKTVNQNSTWLKDYFLKYHDQFDGLINYEALILEINRELSSSGKQPLQIIYLQDALFMADSPLAYIKKNNTAKEKLFLKLQNYLMTDEVQKHFLEKGWRSAAFKDDSGYDKKLFNPDWGWEINSKILPVPLPAKTVLRTYLFNSKL